MQLRYRFAAVVAVGAAVLLAVLRLGNERYAASLCVAVVAAALLFLLCGTKPFEQRAVFGNTGLATAAAAALTGTVLIVSAVSDVVDLSAGMCPYPQPVTLTAINQLLLFVMIGGGVSSGLFFVFTGIRWFTDRGTSRGLFSGAALLPVLWIWARLIWYMTSFASAANRFRSLPEVAMLLFEMLFLFVFARYVSGVEEKTPRFVVPVALCTVLFGVAACITRFASLVGQNADRFADTALITAPDIGITVLAAVWVAGQLFGEGEVAPPLSLEAEEEPVSDEPQGEVAEESFVLDETSFDGVETEEEEEEVLEGERRPLELEDIINDIISGKL